MDQNTQIVPIQNHVNTAQIANQRELVLEERYEQLIELKLEYYLELKQLQDRLSTELNKVPSILDMFKLVKLTYFQNILDRLLKFLDLNKERLKYHWIHLKHRFNIYSKEITNIIRIQREIPQDNLQEIINRYTKLSINSDPITESNPQLIKNQIINENLGQDDQAGHITGSDSAIGSDPQLIENRIMNENLGTEQFGRFYMNVEARERYVNWILNTLKSFLREIEQELLSRLQNSAAIIEERIYNTAASHRKYEWKISQKMIAAKKKAEELQIAKPNLQIENHMDQGLGDMQTQASTNPAAQSLAESSKGLLQQTEIQMPAGMMMCHPVIMPAGVTDAMEVQHSELNLLQRPSHGSTLLLDENLNSNAEPPHKKTKRNDHASHGILVNNSNIINVQSDADLDITISDYDIWW